MSRQNHSNPLKDAELPARFARLLVKYLIKSCMSDDTLAHKMNEVAGRGAGSLASIRRHKEGAGGIPTPRTIGIYQKALGIPEDEIDLLIDPDRAARRAGTGLREAGKTALAAKLHKFTEIVRMCHPDGDVRREVRLLSLLSQALERNPTVQEIDYALLAFAQLQEDFSRSLIDSPKEYVDAVNRDLYRLFEQELEKRNKIMAVSDISALSLDGEVDPRNEAILKNTIQKRGRKILVNVSSVSVAACAVIQWLIMLGLDIELTTLDASGREQFLGLRKAADSDFIIVADAPMLFEKHDNARLFLRKWDIHTERQMILKKAGNERDRAPIIHLSKFILQNISFDCLMNSGSAIRCQHFLRKGPLSCDNTRTCRSRWRREIWSLHGIRCLIGLNKINL